MLDAKRIGNFSCVSGHCSTSKTLYITTKRACTLNISIIILYITKNQITLLIVTIDICIDIQNKFPSFLGHSYSNSFHYWIANVEEVELFCFDRTKKVL